MLKYEFFINSKYGFFMMNICVGISKEATIQNMLRIKYRQIFVLFIS